jgi:hypothetical protein
MNVIVRKLRPPRDLTETYLDAETAARSLESFAKMIRMGSKVRPLVKWNLKLFYWSPDWLNHIDGTVVQNITYSSTTRTVSELDA